MTLFYDQSDGVYLQKQVEVKSYVCDQNGNILRSIGKTILNIAEYANKQKFGLQIQIQGENKKGKQEAIITFQMNMQRQDDDSKSVNTMSEQQIQYRSKQLNQPKQQRKSKSKEKNNFLFPTGQSNVSVKSAQERFKQSNVSSVDEKYSEQNNRRVKQMQKQKSPIKYLDEINKDRKKQEEPQTESENHFFNKFQGKQVEKADIIAAKDDKIEKQKIKRRQSKQKKDVRLNKQIELKQKKESSQQLKLHVASKKLSNLQKQNNQLKNQNNRLKQIIEQLLNDKTKKQKSESSNTNESRQQIQYYKKIIVEKEMKINELQGLNKIIGKREQEKQKEIKINKSQIKQLKTKLYNQKNKIAKILQTAMESQNTELLQIVQNQLNDQFY